MVSRRHQCPENRLKCPGMLPRLAQNLHVQYQRSSKLPLPSRTPIQVSRNTQTPGVDRERRFQWSRTGFGSRRKEIKTMAGKRAPEQIQAHSVVEQANT